MIRFLNLYVCLVLLSCQSKVTESYPDEIPAPAVETSIREVPLIDSMTIEDTSVQRITNASTPAASIFNQSVRILFAGTFHGNEVEVGVDGLPWFGLFSGDSGDFLLQKTAVIAKRVVDGIVDDEASGEMTGWEISTASTESPVMLVWQQDLVEGLVDGLDIPGTIYPGDSVRIEFRGVQYLLTATGSTVSHTDVTTVSDYSLLISRTDKGITRHTVLVSHAAFDDAMTSILWSGDLDGDGYLDLLIDMSNHYNRSAPTLFLSKPADGKNAVVPVAEHSSVGC